MSGESVVVTGRFNEDGSCAVFRDGVPLFTPAERPRVEMDRGRAYGIAPDTESLHEILCATAPYPERRYLRVYYGVPIGRQPVPGKYVVRAVQRSWTPDVRVAGAYLSDPFYTNGPGRGIAMLGGRGSIGIRADTGLIIFDHVDSASAVGRFRFIGRRQWGMQ